MKRFTAHFRAATQTEAASKLKNLGEFECPVHHEAVNRQPMTADIRGGEAEVPVDACCYEAVVALERALNASR